MSSTAARGATPSLAEPASISARKLDAKPHPPILAPAAAKLRVLWAKAWLHRAIFGLNGIIAMFTARLYKCTAEKSGTAMAVAAVAVPTPLL